MGWRCDKNYYGAAFEAAMADAGIKLLRPARKGEPPRARAHLFKPLRQIIESVNDTLKASSISNNTAATSYLQTARIGYLM